jgi:D-glycero-D-manno-heptose 1,7-bisphosphate phosphatase
VSRAAVFLDRDGTLVEEAGYPDRLDRLAFFPYTVDAVRLLNQAGLAVVVATNQSAVARGLIEESFIAEAHEHISARLVAGGARVDAYYYCPHHPKALRPEYRRRCDCRKPAPGMLYRASHDLDLDLTRSFAVGDRWHDLQAGHAVGARGVLVRTGYGRFHEAAPVAGLEPDAIVDNLMQAVTWILRHP